MAYEETKRVILSADKQKLDKIVDVFNLTADETLNLKKLLLSSLERHTYKLFTAGYDPDEIYDALIEEISIVDQDLDDLQRVGKLIYIRELQLRGDNEVIIC